MKPAAKREIIGGGYPKTQRGAAILAITMLILIVATIGTLMVGRVGLFEQKAVGMDVRSKEVYSAAVGGLDYGLKWFEDHFADTDLWDTSSADATGKGATASPDSLANADLNADDYSHQITYTLKSPMDPEKGVPVVVEVASTATAVNDSHVSKTVTVDVVIGVVKAFAPNGDAGNPDVFTGPPILIEGCTSSSNTITGQPDIIYNFPNGVAVGTTTSMMDTDNDGIPDTQVSVEDCIDIDDIDAHLNLCDSNNNCEDADAFVAGGGEFRDTPDSPQSLWSTIFGTNTQADLYVLEAQSPTRILIVDATYPHYAGQPNWNGQQWHANVGTATAPVILFFDTSVGCPSINGGTEIYGLVYYETVDCGNQGWGGGTIHGTVAKAGDLSKLNANAVIIDTDIDFSEDVGDDEETIDLDTLDIVKYAEIPGSWRDY